MSAEHLQSLDLGIERVRSTVDFLTSYARFCRRESRRRRRQIWDLTVEAASALVEAGQWAMLTDPRLALELWREAALLYYHDLHFGFGYFLMATVGPRADVRSEQFERSTARALESLIPGRDQAGIGAEHNERRSPSRRSAEPLRHAQQQVYLVLAGASVSRYARDPLVEANLRSVLRLSPHRNGVTPVGALGTPIRTLWEVADLMSTSQGSTRLPAMLTAMSRRFEEAVELAMSNEYLWRSGASPVEVGNVDLAVLTISATRLYGHQFRDAMHEKLGDLGSVGRAQVEIYMEVADEALEWEI